MSSNQHQKWLLELTSLPTAAGREQRVVAWIEQWVKRRKNLRLTRDKVGNLLITQRTTTTGSKTSRRKVPPLFITAHLDHPAFVMRRRIDDRTVELEFRGGVHDPYFESAIVEIFDEENDTHRATLLSLNSKAKPFKRVAAQLDKPERARSLQKGDIARWVFDSGLTLPVLRDGILYTHAADDLAAVAAALATLDSVRNRKGMSHVGILFTVAEEVGFVGAIGACKYTSVPKSSRLICLENSRSFPESPIGAGPILRVGDRISVFDPRLTNRIGAVLTEYQKKHPQFKWQRKLMPGGACEATAFSTYGYQSTCICLPLGNYHNMTDIDGVQKGKSQAKVGPEYISIEDYHGMIRMLVICAEELDSAKVPEIRKRMEELFEQNRQVLQTGP